MPAISSLLIYGGAITFSALAANQKRRRRLAMLETVARRRGGQFESGGWFGVPRVELTSPDGIQIDITQWPSRRTPYTEYRAYIPPPGLPRCRITPTDLVGQIGSALGAQDIQVGTYEFDDAFTVKGDDPALVRRMWPESCARTMVAIKVSRLECAGTDLKLWAPGTMNAGEIELGVDLILELGRTDPYGIDALESLPERRMRTTTAFPHAELPGPSKIHAGPREQGGVVRTCVWTVAVGAPDADLPEDVATAVTALGVSLDRTSAELCLWWPGIETDSRRLMAAVELLRRISSAPSLGVFR